MIMGREIVSVLSTEDQNVWSSDHGRAAAENVGGKSLAWVSLKSQVQVSRPHSLENELQRGILT